MNRGDEVEDILESVEGDIRNTRISVVQPDVSPISFYTSVITLTMGYILMFMRVWGIDLTEPGIETKIAVKVALTLGLVMYLTRVALCKLRGYTEEPGLVVGYSNDIFIEETRGLQYVGRAREVRLKDLSSKEHTTYISYKQDLGVVEVELQDKRTIRFVCRGLKGYKGITLERNKNRVQEDVYILKDEKDAELEKSGKE